MPKRHELTDAAWARLAPLLPPDPRRGEKWRDHRTVINGILWKLATGCRGGTCRRGTGRGRRCHARLLRWQRDGTWARLLRHVQQHSDAVGAVVWEVSVDRTVVRAHQHAAGARKKSSYPAVKPRRRGLRPAEAADAPGRSGPRCAAGGR